MVFDLACHRFCHSKALMELTYSQPRHYGMLGELGPSETCSTCEKLISHPSFQASNAA